MILPNAVSDAVNDPAIPGCSEDAPTSPNKTIGNRQWMVAAIVTLLVGVVPAVIWPGAASWMCDEPLLIGQAHYYNVAHRLAPRGVAGTVSVPYGPLPTQFYQLFLLFSNDLRLLVALRAFLCSATLAGAFLWLARTLRLNPWFAAAVMLAPYLWWSERVLWDASFALPLGALGVAAYASFLATRSGRSLVIAIGALTLVPLIHLQGLPLFAAFVGHALWRHRPVLLRNWVALGAVLLAIGILNLRYVQLLMEIFAPRIRDIFHRGYVGNGSESLPRFASLAGPFLGGRLFSGDIFASQMNPMSGSPHLMQAAVLISRLVIPLIWIGIATCVMTLAFRWKRANKGRPTAQNDPAAVRTTIIGICLTCLLMQIMLAISLHVPPYPQYCFGTFPIHVLFAWFAIDVLQRVRLGMLVTIGWGMSLAYITLGSAWHIHRHGWNRYCMSPTLSNQMGIARSLNRYNDRKVLTDVSMYKSYSIAMRELRLILPPDATMPLVCSPHGLLIRYRPDSDPAGSRIELIEIRSPADIPAGSFEIDVTPMPAAY